MFEHPPRRYGIVAVKLPESFRPKLGLDTETMSFPTRRQAVHLLSRRGDAEARRRQAEHGRREQEVR
jgi:hypothetical protein